MLSHPPSPIASALPDLEQTLGMVDQNDRLEPSDLLIVRELLSPIVFGCRGAQDFDEEAGIEHGVAEASSGSSSARPQTTLTSG